LDLLPLVRTDIWILSMLLFACFICISLSRHVESHVFIVLFRCLISLSTPEVFKKLGLRLGPLSMVLLSLLFIFSTSICLTLFFHQYEKNMIFDGPFSYIQGVKTTLFVVVFCLFYHVLTLLFSAFITGEKKLFYVLLHQLFVNVLWMGIPMFVLGLFWILNPPFSTFFFHVFMLLIISVFLLVLLKCIWLCVQVKVRWIYIILYLCTFEIVPLFLLNALLLPYAIF